MITMSTAIAAVILKKWADVEADWAPAVIILAVLADFIVGIVMGLVVCA